MSKIKQVVSGLVIAAFTVAVVPAFAVAAPMNGNGWMRPGMMHGHPGPGGWRHGPMMNGGWMQNAPVPMLMPIVWRHAVDLKLTPAQDTDLINWRNTQHKHFPMWRRKMLANNRALRDALLQGASSATIAPLKAAILKDHNRMLEHGIQQVTYLHKILAPVQWQKVTRMYQAMGHKRGPWG